MPMPTLGNAQEAFDSTMLAFTEALEEIDPEAAQALAQWNLEVAEKKKTVAGFSTSYDPGVQLHVGVRFEDGLSHYFAKSLAPVT